MLAKTLLGLGAGAGLLWLLVKPASAESSQADRLIDASERQHPRVKDARTLIGNALKVGTRVAVLAAGAQVRELSMPKTAGNVIAYAATMPTAPTTTTPTTPTTKPPAGGVPADVIAAMTAALATTDPAQMERLADELAARGYAQQAADLRNAAKVTREAQAAAAGAGITLPSLPSTGTPAPTLPGGPVDPKQLLAGKLVLSRNSGKDDRVLVTAFQKQEQAAGNYTGAIDGLYGPKSAVALLAYGFVPPKPKYWPKAAAEAKLAREAYRKLMLARASTDPPRADEWRRASQV